MTKRRQRVSGEELALAMRSLDEMKGVESIGVHAAARVAGRLRMDVVRHLQSKTSGISPRTLIVDEMSPILVKGMLAGDLLGRRRTQILAQRARVRPIALAVYDDVLTHLTKLTKIDVSALQSQYETRALRVLNDVADDVEETLRSTLNELISSGSSVRESVDVLGETFDKLGLSPSSPSQLETIFRTQMQMAYSVGKYQAEQDPDVQEILWGYKYVTVGDDRVREEHAVIDGTTLPKDDPFWDTFTPPNGWNCRCQVIPVFEEREIVKPGLMPDGSSAEPDADFRFNPGEVFADTSITLSTWPASPLIVMTYNPDQPRDPDGKFASGGSSKRKGRVSKKSDYRPDLRNSRKRAIRESR